MITGLKNHRNTVREYKDILLYLDLIDENPEIISYYNVSFLSFRKNGFKNIELENKLKKFMIDDNLIPIRPITRNLKNKLATIIFSF